ncbi:MAG: hypothetical protein LBI06_08500 [Treponema sp.]|nr:hypothetical protein [Treponema sp.]
MKQYTSHTPAAVGAQRGSVRTCRVHLRSLRSAPAGNSKGIRYPAAPQQRRAYVGKREMNTVGFIWGYGVLTFRRDTAYAVQKIAALQGPLSV